MSIGKIKAASSGKIEFRKKLLVRALTLALSATALTIGVSSVAYAQTSTTGIIFGKVTAAEGDSVVIENIDTGAKRTVTPDSTGRFQATALPPGRYKAQLLKNNAVVATSSTDVFIGQGSEIVFAGIQAVEAVQVVGRRQTIDVSSSNNGATFTAAQLDKLPVARNVNAIVQLAPNTTRADSRYSGGASFGGGGPSENSYYINGFPVTNPLSQLGASELPFGAIGQAQVLTGGFGAEFGRSVGGVVNITTKSGTNNWEVGGEVSIAPQFFRDKPRNVFYPATGAPENAGTDGKLLVRREDNERDVKTFGAYVGGPIIKDKLFMFLSGELIKDDFSGVNLTSASTANVRSGWTEQKDEIKRYMGKFDWNITDNHRLEATLIGDKPTRDEKLSGYDYTTRDKNGIVSSSAHYTNVADHTSSIGADAQIIKYTGNFTEDLTLTALYGKSKSEHINAYDGYDVSTKLYQVIAPVAARFPGFTYTNPQPLTGNILPPGAQDEIKSFRFDVEYKLGKHTLRAGLDDNKLSSINAGDFRAGGGIWDYRRTTTPLTPIAIGGTRVAIGAGAAPGTPAAGGYYGRERIFTDVTNAYSDQSAQYIEDRFQITKNFLLTAGLRNEQFTNKNGDNVTFLEQKNQIAPRFGAAWDVSGDASLKLFGSAGRYHIQIPTHIAVRGASRSTFTDQYFTYTGVDAQGAPIGRADITPAFSANNEYGQAKDARQVSALDMKPTYQDEITLGFEKAFSPALNFGTKLTYRDLKSTIDDLCDFRPFEAYATRNNIDTTNWGGFGCATFNPGKANDFLVDYAGTGTNLTRVHLTKEELGMPDVERKYTALDFFAEHPLRNGWYGKLNYTWSISKGNTEGQTLSDVAQTDVAATQTWDHPELMEYANGLLPNHRRHQIKAYGFYELTPQITMGGNLLLASGRPVNCIGNHPTIDPNVDYGSSYRYCNGVPSPRGSTGSLPWDKRVDLNFVFKSETVKGLAFKVDIFNVTDEQTAQTIDEVYNVGNTVSPTYGRVLSYTAPRSFKFSLGYEHKF
ncbi:MAG: TonB-dependent receptor [Burkholderiales bacterium]